MGDRKYPSIMELALRAGKWSVLAGSGAVILGGATGCEFATSGDMVVDTYGGDVIDANEDFPDVMGVTDVTIDFYEPQDVQEPLDYGFPELMGVAPEDIGTWDNGADVVTPDVAAPDVVETDPGLMGDFIDDAYYPPQDVVAPEDVAP